MRPAAAFLCLALFASAASSEPRIKRLQAELSGRQVLVSVELAEAFVLIRDLNR